MENKKDEMSERIAKTLYTIYLTLTIFFGLAFVVNLGDSFVDDSADYITPMLYGIGFGVFTLITRLGENK